MLLVSVHFAVLQEWVLGARGACMVIDVGSESGSWGQVPYVA
jgi:hypothetical protein